MGIYDNTKRYFKKKFTTSRVKELEQMRILSSGRSSSDMEKVCAYLDTQLQEDLDLIENDFFIQARRLEEGIDERMKKKGHLHSNFHDEVYIIISDNEHEM